MLKATEHEIILLINVKMPTIVGILTFINMINIASESLKARKTYIFHYFTFNEQLKYHAQVSMTKFDNLWARSYLFYIFF